MRLSYKVTRIAVHGFCFRRFCITIVQVCAIREEYNIVPRVLQALSKYNKFKLCTNSCWYIFSEVKLNHIRTGALNSRGKGQRALMITHRNLSDLPKTSLSMVIATQP